MVILFGAKHDASHGGSDCKIKRASPDNKGRSKAALFMSCGLTRRQKWTLNLLTLNQKSAHVYCYLPTTI
jgi:hypothetical protein